MAKEQLVLTAGWESWPPYQYLDPDNRLVGLDVEMLKVISAKAGYSIEFRELPWKRHMEDMKRGTIHLASGVSYTDEREQFMTFSIPYRFEIVRLYIRRGENGMMKMQSLADLIGSPYRIGVQAGYYYGALFEKLKEHLHFSNHFESVYYSESNFKKLMMNRIDGLLADPYVAAMTLKSLGYTGQVEMHPMTIHEDKIHIAFSKKSVNQKIVDAFNAAIKVEKSTGTIPSIITKWLK